ncbi:hypothetical protein [Saccharomonospora iraqiensis]|uniref:hypothetical protein n=1 Tax=Saccharomonospora iraqiensis TaxID=52698 RepID=UPI0018DD24C1|nr:hypothetical protein [Saccharomonospora iraqiensis]
MKVEWTQARSEHIATRSDRYPGATDIEVAWTREVVADPRAVIQDPDPRSTTGAVRIVGYSPTAGFVITVIALHIHDQLWGVTAWQTSGAERRNYQEMQHD